MSKPKRAIGVDWASDNWLAVEYRDEAYEGVTLADDFGELWEEFDPKPDQVLVDVPIGLVDENDDETAERGRECDTLARKVLSSRAASVFTPPTRQAAELASDGELHETVSATNDKIAGKGLSIQAHHIAPGIAEVDAFLNSGSESEQEDRRDRVEEAHPEVCFAAFNGASLEYAKTSAVGFGERLSALETVVANPGETFRTIAHDLRTYEDETAVSDVDADDVLDAMALAISACADESERQQLPRDPPADHHQLPMQMVYRAEEPFEVRLDD